MGQSTSFKACFFVTLFFLLPAFSHAQQHQCGFDELHQHQFSTDSVYRQRTRANEKGISEWLQSAQAQQRSSDEVYTIPVVVHVMYADKNAPHNISDAQVKSAIRRLNEIYNNSDGNSVDANIEFRLAARTPDCQPTSGIVRVDASAVQDYATEGIDIEQYDTDGKGANRLNVTQLSRWNPSEYLNIWVVNEISNNNAGFGTQGFSSFPGTNVLYDGVVILYNAFGFDYDNCNCFQLKSFTEENEIVAHEIGHYFNLYHTFEGDGGGLTCPDTTGTAGDKVADTPAHVRTFSCPSIPNSCYPAGHPYQNLSLASKNYMGYADQACQMRFTQGQVDRMRASIETSRSSLKYSFGHLPVVDLTLVSTACTPQTSLGLGAEYGMGITEVKIGNFQAASGSSFQDGGYQNNYCKTVKLQPGTLQNLEIKTYGFYNEDLRVFIDYNNDGVMGPNELIFSSNNKSLHTGIFMTPDTVLKDMHLRMRIISDHFQYNINNACYVPNYGQVEDYSVLFPSSPEIGPGKALVLNGDGGDLETDINFDPATQPFTIEFWCKPLGEPSQLQILFDKTEMDFSSTFFLMLWHKKLFAIVGQDILFLDPYQQIEYGTWQHIAYTWDGSVQRFFLNGRDAGQDSVSVMAPNTAPFTIGSLLKNYYSFNGHIDDLRFWQGARSGTQIREGMHLPPQGAELPLAWFRFNNEQTAATLNIASYSATIDQNASLKLSTANIGTMGDVHSTNHIHGTGVQDFSNAKLSFDFTAKSDTSDFTVSLQKSPPNTVAGVTQSYIFDKSVWTVNRSTAGNFNANLTFTFPESTFFDFTDYKYVLYHRSSGSDSDWAPLINGAYTITDNTICFQGVKDSGQFLIAKE